MLGVVETNDFDEFEVAKGRCQCVYPSLSGQFHKVLWEREDEDCYKTSDPQQTSTYLHLPSSTIPAVLATQPVLGIFFTTCTLLGKSITRTLLGKSITRPSSE